MRSRTHGSILGVIWVVAIVAGCSGSGDDSSIGAASTDQANPCEGTANAIIERFDQFIEPLEALSPEEFLATSEVEGLDEFRDDVGELVATTAQPNADGCGWTRLQATLDVELQRFAGEGLLADFLVDSVRTGGQRSVRDVLVGPDDDVAAILALLDSGSSMTFRAGTYEIETTLLIRSGVTLVGAGRAATLINSSAADAAVAVFGGASLVMRDLTIAHTGSDPASVVVAFSSPVDLDGVRLTGAVSTEAGAGGGGLILTATAGSPSPVIVTVSESELVDNAVAGIAVTADLEPTLIDNVISRNGACGLCYFDSAAGQASGNTIESNAIGIQTSDRSAPEIVRNTLTGNASSGLLVDDASAPTVVENVVEGNGEVGVGVQAESTPTIDDNRFGAHPLALSISGMSTPLVQQNTINGADVAVQLSGQADPSIRDNEIVQSVVAAILHREASTGTITGNSITTIDGVGAFVESSAQPTLRSNTFEGGELGISYTATSGGTLEANSFSGQGIAIDVADDAAPRIEGNSISRTVSAGVVFRSRAAGTLRGNTIVEPGTIGVQLAGSGDPLIEGNRIEGGQTGAAVIEQSAASLVDNTLLGQVVGIDVSGGATPRLEGNLIEDVTTAGIAYHEDSAGVAEGNTVLNPSLIGMQVDGSAHPTLRENVIFARPLEPDPASTVGLLYGGDSAGTAFGNQILGLVIGIQLDEAAMPTLDSNFIDGGGLGGVGVIYDGDSTGTATANRTANHEIGFQLGGEVNPVLEGNLVESADVAAFLLRESATGSLTNNLCPGAAAGIVVIERALPSVRDNPCPAAT